jgi:hypothetical protein
MNKTQLSVIMQNVKMQSVFMLNAIMQSVFLLNAIAPKYCLSTGSLANIS